MSQPSQNAFEAGTRKVIPAVLVYLRWKDQVLMIFRNSKAQGRVDFHEGKWNGLGGKLEADESPLEAGVREIKEEAQIDLNLEDFKVLGVLQFPNFKPHKKEDWLVYVLTARMDSISADPPRMNPDCKEGELHWKAASEISSLNLWPGDRLFIPWVLKEEPFVGTLWYENSQVARHWIQGMGKN